MRKYALISPEGKVTDILPQQDLKLIIDLKTWQVIVRVDNLSFEPKKGWYYEQGQFVNPDFDDTSSGREVL